MIHIKIFNSSLRRIDSDGYTEHGGPLIGVGYRSVYLKNIQLTIKHSLNVGFRICKNNL